MILLLTMMNRTLLFHRHIAPGRWYCLLASGALSLILLVYKKCISLGRQPCCVAYSMMGVWAHLEASLTCSSGQIKRCTDTHTLCCKSTPRCKLYVLKGQGTGVENNEAALSCVSNMRGLICQVYIIDTLIYIILAISNLLRQVATFRLRICLRNAHEIHDRPNQFVHERYSRETFIDSSVE